MSLADAELVTVEGPWWALRPDSPVHRQARLAAARDAAVRAGEYAEAFGGRLGDLLEAADTGLLTVTAGTAAVPRADERRVARRRNRRSLSWTWNRLSRRQRPGRSSLHDDPAGFGSGGHMIIITGRVTGTPETIDELLAASLEHVRRSRGEPGCVSHAVHRDAENPLRLVFFERWESPQAVRAHFAVPASGSSSGPPPHWPPRPPSWNCSPRPPRAFHKFDGCGVLPILWVHTVQLLKRDGAQGTGEVGAGGRMVQLPGELRNPPSTPSGPVSAGSNSPRPPPDLPATTHPAALRRH